MKKSVVYTRWYLASLLFVVLIPGSLTGCKKSTTDMPGPNEVWIDGMAFTPRTITVAAGTTITWTNKEGINHDVSSTTGLFTSPTMSTNATYSHQFNTAGTFPYICSIHPSMTATVIVN